MERELRDVVSKLTACVAMRYAAESNLQYIAETEKQERSAWEAEFSSCAHPAVILPPGGVSRRRRSRVSGSNRNNNNNNRNDTKGTVDLRVSSFSSDTANPANQHVCHQQQRFFYHNGGQEEPQKQNLMGSARFLFTSNPALEHRLNPSSGNGFGGRDARSDPARGGTKDRNITRWGSDRAVFKGPFSPYKLAVDETSHELDQRHGFCEMASFTPSTNADRPRRCAYATGAFTNSTHETPTRTSGALVAREGVLRRSTWLGPEVSPLPVRNEQDAPRLNSPSPFAVKFAAAAWPSPKQKQNGRWRGLNRDFKGCQLAQGGSNSGDPERGVRPQCRRGCFHQRSISGGRTENNPPGGVSDPQASTGMGLGAGSTSCTNRRNSIYVNTESAAGRCSKERLDSFVSIKTGEIQESPPHCQIEACPRPFNVGCSSSIPGAFADARGRTPAETRPLGDGTREQRTETDEPSPTLADPQQGEQEGGADQMSVVSPTNPTGGAGCSEQVQTLSAGGTRDHFRGREDTSASFAHQQKETAAAGRASRGGKLVAEWSTDGCHTSEDDSVGIIANDPAKVPNKSNANDENVGSKADADRIPRPTSADAALVPSKTRSGGVAASPSSRSAIPFQFATPELMSTVIAVRGTVGARRQQQQRSQVPAESRPHHQQTEPLVLVRQPSFQQRRNASEDQDDRSDCTASQEKHVVLLTRRLKQLVQLESLTIQWERLPRREREKLDRQQHLIGSRFRVTEQLRRDSSLDVCVVPSTEGASFGIATVQSGGGGGGGGRRSNSLHAAINHQGKFLPPSDAAISSSIDCPQDGVEVAGAESAVTAADMRGKEGVRVEAMSGGAAAGKVPPDHPISRTGKVVFGSATPRGERRRRGTRGGIACSVQDADIVSGLVRRGRLGDPFIGIVGTRSSITIEDQ